MRWAIASCTRCCWGNPQRDLPQKKCKPLSHPAKPQSPQSVNFQNLQSAPPSPSAVVVLLVGLPGSGKSKLADEMCSENPASLVRVCQDDIGTRKKCMNTTRAALRNHQSCIIDRVNHTVPQRSGFIEIAHEENALAAALVLDVPSDTCLHRVALRGDDHPTLCESKASWLVPKMAAEMQLPSAPSDTSEKLDAVEYVSNGHLHDAKHVLAGLLNILASS